MNRTCALAIAVLVVIGSMSAGISALPAAAQEDDRPTTVELGVDEGATVCVQQVGSDTNQLIVQNDDYGDVTLYLDENRRVEFEQTQPEATVILETDRQNEALNELAEAGKCLAANQTDIVVDASSVSMRGLSATEYAIEVGPDSEIPESTVFDAPNESDDDPDGIGDLIDGNDESDGMENGTENGLTDPINDTEETPDPPMEAVENTTNQTEGTVSDTVDQTEETVSDTVDQTEETVSDTVNHTEETVNDTADHVENTTEDVTETVANDPNETDEQLAETTEETGEYAGEQVDNTSDFLRETTAETTGSVI
ncbi:hypothetical protein [Natrinema gelatinilyticum]|uniref:hypothetical protein n=1 Tax=Natrinema gelatinilyticum TaxID=2961571 RepID=UPI0020C271DC|nr:hypothetical protein [Natrinema gelatinilyticum]